MDTQVTQEPGLFTNLYKMKSKYYLLVSCCEKFQLPKRDVCTILCNVCYWSQNTNSWTMLTTSLWIKICLCKLFFDHVNSRKLKLWLVSCRGEKKGDTCWIINSQWIILLILELSLTVLPEGRWVKCYPCFKGEKLKFWEMQWLFHVANGRTWKRTAFFRHRALHFTSKKCFLFTRTDKGKG